MTVTKTLRLGLTQWGDPSDPDTRAQHNADNQALDNGAAMFAQGKLNTRPASTAQTPGKPGRIYVATDLVPPAGFYDTGSGWLPLSPLACGVSVITSDANGNATVPHTLGAVPRGVVAMIANDNGGVHQCQGHSNEALTATTFALRFTVGTSVAANSTLVVAWIAFA